MFPFQHLTFPITVKRKTDIESVQQGRMSKISILVVFSASQTTYLAFLSISVPNSEMATLLALVRVFVGLVSVHTETR